MPKRLFTENLEWTNAAAYLFDNNQDYLEFLLNTIETEAGESIDLRDMHYIIVASITDFVARKVIERKGSN